jgi:multicomponent Na+:H+ antiporter subunit A
LGRAASGWIVAILPVGLLLFFLSQIGRVESGEPLTAFYPWVPGLGIGLSFYLDGLSLLFALLISGMGALVIIYGGGYLAGHRHLGRFYGLILLFMGSMLGLVTAGNVITLFVFWELTSISSFLLIGFDHERQAARSAALKALLVTGAGGLALLAGLLLLGQVAGSLELIDLLAQGDAVLNHPLYLPILLLILAGAFTKSAQVPFHFWLPAAMEAPTPVSAYLHSATMVKAGIYLLARLSPILGTSEGWHYLVTGAGVVTMLTGAALALGQIDLKRILAYSTVSALGALVLLMGLDTTLSVKAAMVFLIVHALYKGALFLVAGAVDHETGTRDVRQLSGLARAMPITAAAAVLAAISMAGLPPMLGFINKELLYEAKMQAPRLAVVITGIGVLANVLLVAAAAIVGVRPFFGRSRETPRTPHEAPLALWLGPVVLSAAGLVAGLWPELLAETLVSAAVSAIQAEPTVVDLKLWHGLNPVLALSVATVAAGVAAYVARRLIGPVLGRVGRWEASWGAPQWYEWSLRGLNAVARAQTALLQSGRLRNYVLIVVATTIGLVGFTLAGRSRLDWPAGQFSGVRFHEWVLAVIILLAALMAVLSRSRLAAVIALGVIGYSVALLYTLFSDPDLAMTQFAIETLTVVLFVLVVYRLPRFAPFSSRKTRIRDGAVALVAGGMMTTLVLMATAAPRQSRLAAYFAEHSLDLARGRNVVNAILVDFRGLDTLGEITVLAIAAVGIFALLRLRLDDGRPAEPGNDQERP